MNRPILPEDHLVSRAREDDDFRRRLVAQPRATIERELGLTLAEGHEIHVHEETDGATHVVLPPRGRYTEAERKEALTGATSLEFLRKTLYDPAPAKRPPGGKPVTGGGSPETLARAAGETMIVTLAAGNQARLTWSPLEGLRTLTAYIAQASMGDAPAGTLEYRALFAVATVLFAFTFAVHALGGWLAGGRARQGSVRQ